MNSWSPGTTEVIPLRCDEGKFFPSIRILFNTLNPGLHGGQATCDPMLEEALRGLIEVRRYTYGRKSDREAIVQKTFGRIGDLVRLRTLCRRLRPHLIHHNSAFDFLAILRDAPLMLLAKREAVPVFLRLHGSLHEAFLPVSGIFNLARQTVLRTADRIGVLSEIEKCEFEEAFPLVRGKVCVVKNIINCEFAAVERQEADRPTVLFLSRFIRKKGPFDLLHAVPLVLKREPASQFLFVGDGEDADAFDSEATAMNLGDAVRRIPHVDSRQSLSLYAKAWMFVFPTYFPEGMPMVIGEAMAAGLPIVSSPTRFSRSYMTEGVHVIYSEPGDVHSIAGNILKLCQDSKLRDRMSLANRKLGLEWFTARRVVREYVDIYQEILKNSGRAQQG